MSFFKSFFKTIVLSFVIAAICATLVGGTVYTRVASTDVDLEKLKIEPKPTIIYDKNGEIIGKFRKEQRDVTAYEEIPIEVIQAVVSTEDREFYNHPGINVKAITRAAYAIFQADGDIVQGGSTVTQQLVKKTYLTDEKKLDRKIKEAVLATSLEKQMSKNEILTNYLNHIFYGEQAYGIRSAVETYFGQTLEEFKQEDRITRIAKAALLGGLPQLPTSHNPYYHPDSAKQRRDAVLANMWTVGYITEDEYKQAKEKPFLILEKPNVAHDEVLKYGEIVTYVLEETAKLLETDFEGAKYSGLEIYTSFDPTVYTAIRDTLAKDNLYPGNSPSGVAAQTSVSIVNPKNGEILALSGGREAPKFTELNRAYQSKRQPGSSFKPIIDYAPAIESGKFHPWSVLVDEAGYTFPGNYQPKNYSGKGNGKMTMVDALRASQNIPAVYLLHNTGIDYAIRFAERLGITFTDADRYLPIALGGLSEGVSTLQMADAYQGFANGGYRIPAHMVKRMVNTEGEVVFEAPSELTDSYRVMQPQTAEYMKYMLQNAVRSGTGTSAQIQGELVGGKTGTTDKNKDLWFTGFTSEFAMSVWLGYDNPESINGGSYMAAKFFSEIGKEVAKTYPDGDVVFTTPKKITPKVETFELKGSYNEKGKVVSLSWENVEDTTYELYRNGKVIAKDLKKTSYKDTELEEGQTYEYRVVGYNNYTNFETHKSNSLSFEVEKKVKAPTSAKIQASDITTNSVALSWSEVNGATNYKLIRDGVEIYSGKQNFFLQQGLKPNTLYHYELIVQNEGGNSAPSSINVTTEEEEAPVTQPTQPTQPTEETEETETEEGSVQ